MKNKMKYLVLMLIGCMLLSSCGGNDSYSSSDFAPAETGSLIDESISEDNAVVRLMYHFGINDSASGESNSFVILDTVKVQDVEYYHGRWSKLKKSEDGEILNSALKTEFFLTKDAKYFYEGTYNYETKIGLITGDAIKIDSKTSSDIGFVVIE